MALKILSPDITHKSDVGGVALDLGGRAGGPRRRRARCSPGSRSGAPGGADRRLRRAADDRRPQAHELIVGASEDPQFGPVMLFGQGGIAVEVIGDRALALPPLNLRAGRAT